MRLSGQEGSPAALVRALATLAAFLAWTCVSPAQPAGAETPEAAPPSRPAKAAAPAPTPRPGGPTAATAPRSMPRVPWESLLVPPAAAPSEPDAPIFDEPTLDFAKAVDLRDWSELAVQFNGRLATFDTLARRQMELIYGRQRIEGATPAFCRLELYFNSGRYLDRPIIYVRPEKLRARLAPLLPADRQLSFQRTQRLEPVGMLDGRAAMMLVALGRAEPSLPAEKLGSLAAAMQALAREPTLQAGLMDLQLRAEAFLSIGELRIIPPLPGARPPLDAYLSPEMLAALREADLPGWSGQELGRLDEQFRQLGDAWRRRDAPRVNSLLAELCRSLPARGGQAYPAAWRRGLENLHNRLSGFTFTWVGFLLAVPLFAASAVKAARRRAWRAGMAVLMVSTLLLLAGYALRWIISGRSWQLPPLANQYETVLAVGLLSSAAACVLECIWRRGVFGLAGALVSAAAMLAAHFQPGGLEADIHAPKGILNSPILSWHVASLMLGYGLIGMSLLVSVGYLASAWLARRRAPAGAPPALSAPADLAGRLDGAAQPHLSLDRCNLVLVQLACLLLAVGTALGAFWADRSWGRWWGWDPKETWALMTLLVYLGIVHVRFLLPDRERGAWTAALSLIGCMVMAFTWWGVNYFMPGLHSYAS